jgi:small-conductance mechanosensitive channel
MTPPAAHPVFAHILDDLDHPAMYWQIGVLLISLVVAWVVDRIIQGRPRPADTQFVSAWTLSQGSIRRVAFPLSALLGTLAGTVILRRLFPGHVHLLELATTLLMAMALIRFTVYMLRKVFTVGAWLKAWERWIAGSVWMVIALHLTGFLPELVEMLDGIGFSVGKGKISVLNLFTGLLATVGTMLVALWLGRALEAKVMLVEALDMNLRVVLSKVGNALLVVVGVLVALSAAGIDLTLLSVFGGALGVGLGFGLQKIASNYVSGFIILLDRSVRPGDTLTVDNKFGQVDQLTARYLVLRSLDGTESIIPNETLITSTVINHSYSNKQIRMNLPVQVAYGSDLDQVMALMVAAGAAQERVLRDPPPKAYLVSFGDSGINMELGVWISDPEEGQLNLRSDINLAMWRAFKEHGVSIPFPQREVRMLGAQAGPAPDD